MKYNRNTHRSRLLTARLVAAGLAVSLLTTVHAADRMWDGAANPNFNWNLAANWGGTAPVANDLLFFGGSTGLLNTNDFLINTRFNGVTFNSGAGAFILRGNEFDLGGGITNSSANLQTIAATMRVQGNYTMNVGAAGLDLGRVYHNASARTLEIAGSGVLRVGGTANGDRITWNVDAGETLVLKATGTATAADQVNLKGGLLRYDPASQTSPGGTWQGQVNSGVNLQTAGSVFDLNGTGVGNNNGRMQSLVGVAGTTMVNNNAADARLQINSRSTGVSEFAGTIADGGAGLLNIDINYGGANGGRINLFSGDNTFRGKVTINSQYLRVGHANALGATGAVGSGSETVVNGGTLDLNGFTVGETISVTSGNNGEASHYQIWNSSATAAQINGNVEATTSFSVLADTGDITLGTVKRQSGSGALTLTKRGAGKLTVANAADNAWMNLDVNAGTLVLAAQAGGNKATDNLTVQSGATARLGSAGGSQQNIGDGATVANSGTLDLNSYSETVGSLNGMTGVVKNDAASTTSTLTLGGNNATGGNFLGAIQNGLGTVAVSKTGSGTHTLSGVNTYTGATTVGNGALLVNGSLGNTLVTVTGGLLGGSGTIGGPVDVQNGTLAPGTSPGTLTLTSTLTLGLGATLAFELAGNDQTIGGGINDLLTGITDLTLDGTLNVTEIEAGSFLSAGAGDKWRLLNYSGLLTDNTLLLGSTPALEGGLFFTIDTTTGGQVNLLVVPEPSGWAIVACGVGALALMQRRRD